MDSRRADGVKDIPTDVPLYIFGAARGGQLLLKLLLSQGYDNIVGFIDDVAMSAPGDCRLQTTAAFLQNAPAGALVLVASEHFRKISRLFEGADVTLCEAIHVIRSGHAYDHKKHLERVGILLSWLPPDRRA